MPIYIQKTTSETKYNILKLNQIFLHNCLKYILFQIPKINTKDIFRTAVFSTKNT